MPNLTPAEAAVAIDAYRSVAEHDADGAEVRGILADIPTVRLLDIERCAVRVIWAARDIRNEREPRKR